MFQRSPNRGNYGPEIAERLSNGDGELYKRLGEAGYTIASRFFRDHADREDVVQASLEEIWKHRDSYNPNYSVFTFVRTVVIRDAIDALKHKRSIDGHFVETATPDRYPERKRTISGRRILDDEKRKVLEYGIKRLDERNQEIIDLRYKHQVPLKEIAKILGIPEKTAKSRLDSAIRNLRNSINEQNFQPLREERE